MGNIHRSAYIDKGAKIGKNTKIWHFCHVMEGAEIGENCILGQNVFIGKNVIVGNFVRIQNNVSLYEGVVIDDEVFLGPSCVFTNVINPRSYIDRKNEFQRTIVGHGATIGANATILCGITIGVYAMIGAGAVVTHNVPAYALMVGVPAKQVGEVDNYGHRFFNSHPRT